jgi:acyl-CoA synthetase (NDP forming)
VSHFLRPTSIAVLEPPGARKVHRGSGLLEANGLGHAEVAVEAITRVPPGYAVPAGTELAVIPDWLDEAGSAALACAEAGVPAVALLGRGRPLADRTRASRLDDQLLDRIRAAGAHLLGPRSACLVNTDPLYRLALGGLAPTPPGGAVAVVTDDTRSLQRLCDGLAARGVGVSVAVDVGVAEDLGPDEFVAWLAQDARSEVIVVLLAGAASESLLSLLGRVHSTRRPVALLAADASGVGAPSASRTGGPCRATTVEGLADLTMLLVSQGMPAGRHVAVVTNEPWTVHAAANRRLARRAMLGPDLRQHSEMRIHFVSPGSASHGAVVALPVDVSAEQVRDVLETLAEDPGVDAIVVDHVPSPALQRRTLYRELRGLGRGLGGPVVVAVDRSGPRQRGPTPVFASVPRALDVLAQACER